MRFLFLFSLATCLFAQTESRFEVATVRPSAGPIPGIPPAFGKQETNGDTLSIRHTLLAEVIRQGFGVTDFELSNLPGWARVERYDIMAKAAGKATDAELWAMVPALLEERFGLKFHRESKQASGQALVVAKSGLKLKSTDGGSSNFAMDGRVFRGRNVPSSRIAGLLTSVTRERIVDGTGLTGTYDFLINLEEYQGVSLPTVIQERMGLTLESRKVELHVMVIDRLEKPTEN